MEQEKLFNIGTILLLATVVVLLIYGILYVFVGTLAPDTLTYIGKTEAEIIAFDPELMFIISNNKRSLGITNISLGIAYILILNFGFRKKEKWAWIAVLIAIVGFVVPLIFNGLYRISFDLIILIIVLIIQIVGAILTYKSFFGAE